MAQYQGTTTKQHGKVNWTGEVRLVESALNKPLRWKKSRRIFVNSMGDLFHPDVPDSWIHQVWEVMLNAYRENRGHVFQILTKHPERMMEFVNNRDLLDCEAGIILCVSVENIEVQKRIDCLDRLIGYTTFVSFEPLIGSVKGVDLTGIDWAIVGGESGKGAWPMKSEWIQEIYDACQQSGTAFFFKQWGAFGEDGVYRSKKANGRDWQDRPTQ